MSYNYSSNRHSSIGGSWHLQSLKDGQSPYQQSTQPQAQSSQQPPIDFRNDQAPGFRNPWFSAPGNPNANTAALSQSPTKGSGSGLGAGLGAGSGPGSGIPLLLQHANTSVAGGQNSVAAQRRLSYATQLPTTYEDDGGRRQLIAPPFIHPPTRADNPFNQYYSSQDVSLGGGPPLASQPDRRMSAVGTYGGQFSYNQQSLPLQHQALTQPPQPPSQNAQQQHFSQYSIGTTSGAAVANRRSSVAGYQKLPFDTNRGAFYGSQQIQLHPSQQQPTAHQQFLQQTNGYPFASSGRSQLIVQYNQYQVELRNQRLSNVRKPAPRAYKVVNKYDLKPKLNSQPKYRRCSVNSVHISPVNALSVYLTESYSICQPKKFQYSKLTNPKRVLTKPPEPKFNNGFDNEDSDYILYVNDILGTEEGRKYIVLDLLGCGTFGQVVKCQNLSNQSLCAIKVIKSKPAYATQSLTEVRLLEFLNANSNGKSFIRLIDKFMHKEHLCLVFELLASNLYELIKQNQFHGLNMRLVKLLARQLLDSLAQLKRFQMIHCDLKPENILLCQPDKPDIKVIDFGSACFTRQTTYTYIQSRFYRSPEVILGLPYSESIDMWSLGCIVGELFLGLPMFPGHSEYNQIWKIVDMLGNPPRHMIELGRSSLNFFHKIPSQVVNEKPQYRVKSYEEYIEWLQKASSSKAKSSGNEEIPKEEKPNKQYFKNQLLKDLILNYKMPSRMTSAMIEKEWEERFLLLDFLSKVLNMNPLERLTPQEALKHPFVNEKADASAISAAIDSAFLMEGDIQCTHPLHRKQQK